MTYIKPHISYQLFIFCSRCYLFFPVFRFVWCVLLKLISIRPSASINYFEAVKCTLVFCKYRVSPYLISEFKKSCRISRFGNSKAYVALQSIITELQFMIFIYHLNRIISINRSQYQRY